MGTRLDPEEHGSYSDFKSERGTVSNEIAQLLELQAIDQQITEALERIKRLQRARSRSESKIIEANQAFANQKEALRQSEHNSLMQNLSVDELDTNIRNYQHRLDTAIISFKEMEDLRAKIISEKKRIGQMEDEALRMMDTIAEDKDALVDAKAALDERQVGLSSGIAEIDGHLEEVEEAITALQEKRATLTESMTDFLVSQYASLRRKFADPIVVISHTTCSGCKLKLSGSTIERVRGSLGLVACEHCSRILYVE